MAERLILDTSILIALERGHIDLTSVAPDEADAALPAIVVAEFLVGVRLAATEEQRTARQALLDRVRRALPVEEYIDRVAEHHATLLAQVHHSGRNRGAHDLVIAATAVATDRIILTTDAHAGFDVLPGVRARLVPA